jgi:hypothetical protein
MLGDPGQHARPNFFAIVKGEDKIGKLGMGEDAMGTAGPLEDPARFQQSFKNSTRFR